MSQHRSGTTSYYHYDALGSTRELTDSNGDVTDTYVYRAFGSLRASTGSTTNRFRYIGKLGYYHEAALAGYYLRHRYYTPEVRRFVSRDPVRQHGGSSYGYVGNRATRATDPSGVQAGPVALVCAAIVVGGGIVVGAVIRRRCIATAQELEKWVPEKHDCAWPQRRGEEVWCNDLFLHCVGACRIVAQYQDNNLWICAHVRRDDPDEMKENHKGAKCAHDGSRTLGECAACCEAAGTPPTEPGVPW